MDYILIEKTIWDNYIEKDPIAIGTKKHCEETLKEVTSQYNATEAGKRILEKTNSKIIKIVSSQVVTGQYYAHELTEESHEGYIECDVIVAKLETGELAIITADITKKYPVTGILAISNDNDYRGKYDNGMGDELVIL